MIRSLAERALLRAFLACSGLRFPVSARRHRLRAPFGAPVSGGQNPVPNSNRAADRKSARGEFGAPIFDRGRVLADAE